MQGKIPYADFRNVSTRKRTRSSDKESDNNITYSSSSDNETTPKIKKNSEKKISAKFDTSIKTRCKFII